MKGLSIALLIALVGFPQISETIYTPALPSVATGLSTSAYMVEATLSIYFLGFAIGVALWGSISDCCGRRPAMLMGLLTYGVATWGCAGSADIEALLAWRFVQAFGASVGSVLTQTILRDAYSGAERAKLFSVMSAALAFSPAIGPLLGGAVSELFGWRANFLLLCLFAVVLSIWTFLALVETRPHTIQRAKTGPLFMCMVQSRALWGHILLIGCTNGIIFSFYQEAPFIFIDHLGLLPSHYGLFGLLIAAATIIAARVSYRQSGILSAQKIIQCGICAVLAGSLFFTLTVLSGMLEVALMGIFLAALSLLLVFFGIGLIIPNSLSQALKPYQATAGTAGSIFGGCYYCLIAGFTWTMGALHDGTALPLPLYMALLGVLLLLGGRLAFQARSLA
ncbi:MAG: multidrug effflux MFS transporter [Verrucomicrobia bacterium]|nr:multidrug effflux MFS transporter [Verrucomicrobiota bacterium]